jgi:hypothetical protein
VGAHRGYRQRGDSSEVDDGGFEVNDCDGILEVNGYVLRVRVEDGDGMLAIDDYML